MYAVLLFSFNLYSPSSHSPNLILDNFWQCHDGKKGFHVDKLGCQGQGIQCECEKEGKSYENCVEEWIW